MYYGQIQENWELDFHGFKTSTGVLQDNYGFISIDLNCQGYKPEPFMLAKHIAQVFYVPDTTNKRLKVVILEKR
jgi:hypothetical protein